MSQTQTKYVYWTYVQLLSTYTVLVQFQATFYFYSTTFLTALNLFCHLYDSSISWKEAFLIQDPNRNPNALLVSAM